MTLATTGVIAQRIVDVRAGRTTKWRRRGWLIWVGHQFQRHGMLVGVGLGLLSAGVLWPSTLEYLETGAITSHWSAVLFGGLALMLAVQLFALGVLAFITDASGRTV